MSRTKSLSEVNFQLVSLITLPDKQPFLKGYKRCSTSNCWICIRNKALKPLWQLPVPLSLFTIQRRTYRIPPKSPNQEWQGTRFHTFLQQAIHPNWEINIRFRSRVTSCLEYTCNNPSSLPPPSQLLSSSPFNFNTPLQGTFATCTTPSQHRQSFQTCSSQFEWSWMVCTRRG